MWNAEQQAFIDAPFTEIKFASGFQTSHAVQAVGYALMLGGEWTVKVLNLKTRVETTVQAEAIVDPARAVAIVTDVIFRSDQIKTSTR